MQKVLKCLPDQHFIRINKLLRIGRIGQIMNFKNKFRVKGV